MQGGVKADAYMGVLEDELMDTMEYYGMDKDEVIFQQDGAPSHTAKRVFKWLKDNGMKVMEWPAQSPDLNPIENLWLQLLRALSSYEAEPQGMLELWGRVEKEWNSIPVEACQKLIESMTDRIRAVIKAKGGYTKY